jgi:ferrochelatase
MIIENLAQICSGYLLKEPLVKAVTSFTCRSDKVTCGGAFFATEGTKEGISEALKNGAYAIIHEQNIQIDDNEIAWIKVDSIERAMIRFMRFLVETNEINAVYMDVLQFDMLNSFKLQFKNILLSDNVSEVFLKITDLEPKSYIFSKNKELLEQISPQFESIDERAEATILQSHSIFKTTFVCAENYFKDFMIPHLFISEFAAIIAFLKKKSLEFKIDSMEKNGHFEPIFVNTALEARPFGSTHQAIIIETDERLFEREEEWIKNYISDNYLLVLAPHNAKISISCKRYTSAKSLQTISLSSLRYVLVLGDKDEIVAALEEPKQIQGTLF